MSRSGTVSVTYKTGGGSAGNVDAERIAVIEGAFKDAAGKRTYVAYNARSTPIRVTFSSGKVIDVPPRSVVRAR